MDEHTCKEEVCLLMQQFLICDDNPMDAQVLANLLQQTAGSNCSIRTAAHTEALPELIGDARCDALFLDIELDDSSGIQFAKEFIKCYPQIPIVFYTAHIRYCEEIFTVSPKALLLKPPTKERVQNVLQILHRLQEKVGYLLLSTGKNNAQRIALHEIAYIENIQRRLTVFHTGGNIIAECYGKKLSEIAAQLGDQFVCCHQSIYVNMQQIADVRRYALHLRNGRELPISQSRFRLVRERWGEFLGESL